MIFTTNGQAIRDFSDFMLRGSLLCCLVIVKAAGISHLTREVER